MALIIINSSFKVVINYLNSSFTLDHFTIAKNSETLKGIKVIMVITSPNSLLKLITQFIMDLLKKINEYLDLLIIYLPKVNSSNLHFM